MLVNYTKPYLALASFLVLQKLIVVVVICTFYATPPPYTQGGLEYIEQSIVYLPRAQLAVTFNGEQCMARPLQ